VRSASRLTKREWGFDLLSALDIAEIQNLYGKYIQTLNHGEAEAWAECFTGDGVFIRPLSSSSVGVSATHAVGRAAIAQVARHAHVEGKGLRRRWFGNAHISPGDSDDEAFGRSSLIVFVASEAGKGDPPKAAGTAMFFDRLKKTEKGWRIAVRALVLDGGVPNPEIDKLFRAMKFK
jgi:hypothetical protein